MATEITGVEETLKKLDLIQRSISDRKTRRQVMRKPAETVVKAARPKVPIYRPKTRSGKTKRTGIHYRYSNGKVVAGYLPGNLRLSIGRLSLRKAALEYIGPRFSKRGKGGGLFGPKTGRVDGYYAAMMAGSQRAFRQKYLEPALAQSAGKVFQQAEDAIEKKLAELERKTGLGK